ncbi:Gp19/Gp15/Gp42 family protein [uncultured Ruminococcus sp.]|uniref:Gp19/Gp15/Gp42 family protein n=1 Tax=uncultured Ruminococcus sp. TaxID=165186 RepID=UPI002620FD86|nr:Gp19/Gp15/Gp42 family protein [uncultured Ruminococcus sp.]
MGTAYCTVNDILALGYQLTNQQQEAAQSIIDMASAKLRIQAKKYGKDIDKMLADENDGEDYSLAVKNVVINATVRALNTVSDDTPALSHGSETNGSYSIQMTYLNAGQSLYFLRNELKDLGLLRQVYGAIEIYDTEKE